MPTYIKKTCKIHGETDYVLEGRGFYRCKKCRSNAAQKRRKKVKRMLVDEFGGGCSKCGYNNCIEALQFHHLDPSEKEFGVAAQGNTKSYARLLEEAKKCVLLCANCHAEIHADATE